MSAEYLRETAQMMREAAKAADSIDTGEFTWAESMSMIFGEPVRAHFASWHPDAADAVAKWLDTAGADIWAHGPLHCANGCHKCDDDLWAPHARRALALARAWRGDA